MSIVVEGCDDLIKQSGGGRNAGFPVIGIALPIGDAGPGSARHRDNGKNIPWIHDRIDRYVRLAGGQQKVAIAVRPGAVEFYFPHKGVETGAILISLRRQNTRAYQCRFP